MEVEYGTLQDIGSWMELVQQVRWNFPGLETQAALEDHRRTVLRFMGEQRALCVKDGEKVIGVLLLSKKHNMICCLAVDPAHRRNGIASALLEKALLELDRSKDITVIYRMTPYHPRFQRNDLHRSFQILLRRQFRQ